MIFILMGVSGSGKTTVGRQLASQLSFEFEDADDYHPISNRHKMQSGTPLNDEDRWPWLDRIKQRMTESLVNAKNVVFACSALKKTYREYLISGIAQDCQSGCKGDRSKDRDNADGRQCVQFIHLKGTRDVISKNLSSRSGHFMPLCLLETQFNDLEEPTEAENAITVLISHNIDKMVQKIINSLVML